MKREISRLDALVALLPSLFNTEELRRFLYLTFGPALVDALPGSGASAAAFAFEAALALDRRGLIDDRLFDALVAERASREADIVRARMT